MKYDFVSIGDVTNDTFITLVDATVHDEATGKEICMRFGDKIPYESAEYVRGVGNAANAAISAKRLGVNAALVTDIGTDSGGDDCLESWAKDNLDVSLVRRHTEYPTHHHYVLRFGAERTILIKHAPWPYVLPHFDELPMWIYFTSTGEHGEPYHHELAQYVKTNNVKLAFQPGTFQIKLSADGKIPDVYQASKFFVCNKEEAQHILGNDSTDIKVLMQGIRDMGPKIVSVTDGPNGAWMMNDEGAWMIPMYPDPAPPKNRTGAGDAYASTVTAMLAAGLSVPDALIRGPINSAFVVQQIGAQKGLLTRAQLEDYLAKAPPEYKITQL
ncbi:carbohydrate kinase family protein [Candidatus Kaiserbacteria bacterium]|nr:carbohydrate kinase family protein [Candidatus Kaiserbacteria bacterium]